MRPSGAAQFAVASSYSRAGRGPLCGGRSARTPKSVARRALGVVVEVMRESDHEHSTRVDTPFTQLVNQ